MMKDMSARYEASYRSKDDGSSNSRIGAINFREAGDVAFFKPELGRNRINIIPYTISSKNHPLVRGRDPIMEIGDLDYVMDIMVHRNVGPSKSSVICLGQYGKPCPICELSAKLKKEGKEKEGNSLKASRRVFYNVEDVKNAPGEVKVFEASHYLFERELIEESRDDNGGIIQFAHPKKGKEITFKVTKEKKGSIEYNKFKNFNFDDREEPLDPDLLDMVVPFDKFLNLLTAEEMEKVLYGSDDDDDEDEEYEEEEVSSKRRRPIVDDDDDEEEERPAKKSRRHYEDDDDDDDNSDDESESKKKSGVKSNNKCPYGFDFGADCDAHPEKCEKCSKWSECSDYRDANFGEDTIPF